MWINSIQPLIHRFNRTGDATSETFAFWIEYLNMVKFLLNVISTERRDWNPHLEIFREMLKYDRAFDHFQCFKWGSIYIIDMLCLHLVVIQYPEIQQTLDSTWYQQIWRWNKA